MTTEKLIKILGAVHPESEVGLQLGRVGEEDYRDACAKAQITGGECLDSLHIEEVVIDEDGDGRLSPNLILRQWNYYDIDVAAADFDKEYTKVRKQPDTTGHTEPAWGDDSERIYTELTHWLITGEPLSMERQTMITEWLKKIRGKLIGE